MSKSKSKSKSVLHDRVSRNDEMAPDVYGSNKFSGEKPKKVICKGR